MGQALPPEYDRQEMLGRAIRAFMLQGDSELQALQKANAYIRFYEAQRAQIQQPQPQYQIPTPIAVASQRD